MRLEGKVAIVTGGANGIGRATVKALAREGADVVIFDIDEPRMAEAVKEVEAHGRRGVGEKVDITKWAEVSAAVERTVQAFGHIDILACVAGGSGTTPNYMRHLVDGRYVYPEKGLRQNWTEEIEEEDWDGTMDFNLKAVFLRCKAVIPHMKRQRKGAIITFSSIGEEAGSTTSAFAYAAYTAAKAGVTGLTHQLAKELGQFGIRTNCVCPGGVRNPRMMERVRQAQELAAQETDESRKPLGLQIGLTNPLGRISEPEEQANAVLFLASDEANYINGVTLDVNGGMYMK